MGGIDKITKKGKQFTRTTFTIKVSAWFTFRKIRTHFISKWDKRCGINICCEKIWYLLPEKYRSPGNRATRLSCQEEYTSQRWDVLNGRQANCESGIEMRAREDLVRESPVGHGGSEGDTKKGWKMACPWNAHATNKKDVTKRAQTFGDNTTPQFQRTNFRLCASHTVGILGNRETTGIPNW